MTTPTVNRWQLARTLRELRGDRPPATVAKALKTTISSVHRWETPGEGGAVPGPGALERLLDFYAVSEEGKERLLQLRRDARKSAWWSPYHVDRSYGMFVDLEAAATSIESYENTLVTGHAQTEEYARAVIRATSIDSTDDEVEEEVQVRLARQQAWRERHVARLGIVMGEAAIRQRVGSRGVMRGQLKRLIEFSTDPKVDLQILPFRVGEHAAIHASGFVILTLGNDGFTTVYTASQTGSLFLDDRNDIEMHATIFNKLRIAALGTGATRALLAEAASDL
ncbi:helix-turn-helix domain-containing protein [Marinitenerispora sediminis]|uniref:helix-turn-helix domain-containing protein n=1 Tax=Marinitenerispora sediminis TaxID=1931232 RepID=UPI0013142904|nr:helix-turn-helix transcriptional regulator [Marinitenerispora sediminis]